MLGLCCCVGFSLVVAIRGYSLDAVCRLIVAVSLVVERGLSVVRASVVAAHGINNLCSLALEYRVLVAVHGLSCSVTHRIFLDQGSNLLWQVDH